MKNQSVVIFDMDGVLIDVSASYRDTIRQAAKLFFKPAPASKSLPDPLFDLSDLAAVKQSGGLNNDWDLTFLIINLLLTQVNNIHIHPSEEPWIRYRETVGRCDVSTLADFLKSTDMPLATLLKKHGKCQQDFVSGLYRNDVGSGNIIKHIFQEIYLGRALFKSTYTLDPQVYQGDGFILREKILIDRPVLEALQQNHILAIATGRPAAEAEYPLNHFKLKKYFSAIYTLDECLGEEKRLLQEKGETVSMSKPNPYMLDAIAEGMALEASSFYYVGDMPDDMLAARRAREEFKAVGFLLSSPDKAALKKELIQSGADYIVEDIEDLKRILV